MPFGRCLGVDLNVIQQMPSPNHNSWLSLNVELPSWPSAVCLSATGNAHEALEHIDYNRISGVKIITDANFVGQTHTDRRSASTEQKLELNANANFSKGDIFNALLGD